MADPQSYFEEFHKRIRIDFDTSAPLREKRDIILGKIQESLSADDLPGFREFLQGSYATDLKTGVKPLAGEEFDIDIGLRFNVSPEEHTAKEVRQWVLDAVEGHTDKVEDKGPCIRVTYADGFHVDLVCYATWDDDAGVTQYRLAHRDDGWRPSDPLRLLAYVRDAMRPFDGTEDGATSTNQFRRVVRYVRRWVDITFALELRPSGIAVVLLAAEILSPTSTWDGKTDDAEALRAFAAALGARAGRIVVLKPTPEYEDLLGNLPASEMQALIDGFAALASTVASAREMVDPVEACRQLQVTLGEDFPVPRREETARKTGAPAIVPSSASG